MNPTNEIEAIISDHNKEMRKDIAAEITGGTRSASITNVVTAKAVQAHINAEIAKAKLEAFDVAFDCHDYDRLEAYRAELLKEVK